MSTNPDTTTCYRVTYAAAGCLPDSEHDVTYWETLGDAADAVADERMGICWMDAFGYREDHSLSSGDVAAMLERFGMVGDPRPDSLYRWSIETLERVNEPSNAHLVKVCGDCLQHAANGECGACHDDVEGTHEPLSRLEVDGQHVTVGMFPEHHADDCPVRYGDEVDECECEHFGFSHDTCEGCGGLPGDRYALTVWSEPVA